MATPSISQNGPIRKTGKVCPCSGGKLGAPFTWWAANAAMRAYRRYRRGVGFVLDVAKHCSTLDRNAKARLLVACEALERRTKAKGRRNGLIGYVGLQILRTLLLRFHGPSGLCCPSIDTLQSVTGLCRQSVVNGLARLEAVGVLKIQRRLQRYRDQLGNLAVRQGTNLYAFRELPALVPIPRVYGAGGNHYPRQSRRQTTGQLQGQVTGPVAIGVIGAGLPELSSVFKGKPAPDWRKSARALYARAR